MYLMSSKGHVCSLSDCWSDWQLMKVWSDVCRCSCISSAGRVSQMRVSWAALSVSTSPTVGRHMSERVWSLWLLMAHSSTIPHICVLVWESQSSGHIQCSAPPIFTCCFWFSSFRLNSVTKTRFGVSKMCLKVSSAHQDCIYLIQITAIIVRYYYDLKQLFSMWISVEL